MRDADRSSGTLGEDFLAACERHAQRPGAIDGQEIFTYGQLRERVLARSADWRGLGLEQGARVALLADNTLPFLEAYFAAALTGTVLVPLNHRLAAPELDRILADCAPRLLLYEAAFADLVAALEPRPTLVRELERNPRSSAAHHVVHCAPGDLAHLYYTSGTTGRPKGVMLTHANVCAHAEDAVRELALTAADRWGHFAPLFHLADAWATFAVTRAGGAHVLPGRFEAGAALAWIERERITLTNLVPTMLAGMLAHRRAKSFDPTSLRLVLSGGAPISPALVRDILDTFRCEYAQTYGLTETSPYLTLGFLDRCPADLPPAEALKKRARTGRPFGRVELQVVDEAGCEVPRDDRTVGEIRARGPTVSPGYWRNPEETARAHRDGWLYTGDLAVVDADGYLDIVDRKKDVILTGGETVYSTEVERVLHEHPSVLEAAVIALPDPRWGERVHAVVALRAGLRATPDELIAFCRGRIAGFKTPRSVAIVASLPKTGSGKIAKRLLRSESTPVEGKVKDAQDD